MKRSMVVAVVLAMGMTLAGCGGGSNAEESSGPSESSTTTKQETAKPKDANEVATALKTAGLPIGEVFVYTAENDDNELLGRPNGYTSKVNFHDTRFELSKSGENNDIDTGSGGSVEVFKSKDQAQARADYITKIGASMSAVAEYNYVQGTTLLRVSKTATPDQAKAYEDAFKEHHVG